MSLIPTASWTTPETSYFATAAGGGGSNFPNGIIIGQAPNSNLLANSGVYYNQTKLTVQDISGQTLPLVVSDLKVGGYSTINVYPTAFASYQRNGINYQQDPTGNNTQFLTVNNNALGSANPAFVLNQVSTITAGALSVNAVQMLSSMKGFFAL